MNVQGRFPLEAPPEAVFRAICDPAILMSVIPGCEALERLSAAEYRGRIVLRLPGIVGTYRTWVRLVDAVAPRHAGLEGRVEGALGSIVGRADFTLDERPGGTDLSYHAHGIVDGPLARLDSRYMEQLAGSLIAQGLRALDRRLSGEAAGAATPGGPRPRTEASA